MGNELAVLPDHFGALRGLVRLGLKSNQLTELPASFTQLINLVELFITDNKLTTLPEGVVCWMVVVQHTALSQSHDGPVLAKHSTACGELEYDVNAVIVTW